MSAYFLKHHQKFKDYAEILKQQSAKILDKILDV